MPGKFLKNTLVATYQPEVQSALPTDINPAMRKWLPFVIITITACIYSRVCSYGFLHMDDDAFILNNPVLKGQGWDGLVQLFTNVNSGKYQPLTQLTFMLEYRLFGFDAAVFHFVTAFFHLLNIWLVFKLTEKLSGKTIAGLVVAALFALHPMHVEEVAWVSELKDTLPAFFYLSALLCYIRYSDSGFSRKNYAAVFLFFLAALLSKSACVSFPLVVLLIDKYKGRPMDKWAWMEKIPLAVFSLVFLMMSLQSKSNEGQVVVTHAAHSLFNRIFLFTYVPSFYIVKAIVPFPLSAMYYYPQLQNGVLPWIYYVSLPFFLFIIWLIFRPSAFRKELAFGFLFFVVTIAFMDQVIQIGPSLTPERYTYIPYIGLFYIIGQFIAGLWHTKRKNSATGVFVCALALFAVITWQRVAVWENDDTIFGDVIVHNPHVPDAYYPYYILGTGKQRDGNPEGAMDDYNESIDLYPDFADVYDKRGELYIKANDMKSALEDFNHAINLNSEMPAAYNNRASVRANSGDFKGAVDDYNVFLKMKPDNKRIYADRGMARLMSGDTTGACADLKTSLDMGNQAAGQLLQQYCH